MKVEVEVQLVAQCSLLGDLIKIFVWMAVKQHEWCPVTRDHTRLSPNDYQIHATKWVCLKIVYP